MKFKLIMIKSFITRIIRGTINGACIGYFLNKGFLINNTNITKYKMYKEYNELPYHGAKIGAVIGGLSYGFYPIIIPYISYKIGTRYELSSDEIREITQDWRFNDYINELIKNIKK